MPAPMLPSCVAPLMAPLLAWVAWSSGTTRVESFVVGDPTAGGAEPVAVVSLRAVARAGHLLLEQDVTFRAAGVRVLHDEHRETDGWHLVRRELRGPESPGRSWIAEPDGDGLRLLRFGSSRPVHGRVAGSPRMPLELLESLRRGEPVGERVLLLDPLGEGLVSVDVRVRTGDPRTERPAPRSRTVALVRADGSLLGRYVFEGTSLVAFQWQDGSRWARRTDEEEVQRRAEEWRVERDPLAEVWEAVRSGRIRRW